MVSLTINMSQKIRYFFKYKKKDKFLTTASIDLVLYSVYCRQTGLCYTLVCPWMLSFYSVAFNPWCSLGAPSQTESASWTSTFMTEGVTMNAL